jgi:hypothetical protein
MENNGFGSADAFGQTPSQTVASSTQLNRAFLLIPTAGLIGMMAAISAYRPVNRTPFLWLGLILFFAIIFLVARIQQKTKRGGDVSSFFPMIYWLAFAPLLLALALWLNGALDHYPPETHRELVTRRYVTHGRRGTSYYIEFTSWRANRTTENVSIEHQLYKQLQTDDPILVDVHRGALAIAWIGEIRKPE